MIVYASLTQESEAKLLSYKPSKVCSKFLSRIFRKWSTDPIRSADPTLRPLVYSYINTEYHAFFSYSMTFK